MEHYEYIRAIVIDGSVRWEYKLKGGRPSSMSHDEDVSNFTEKNLIGLTKAILDVEEDDPVEIEVRYE